jgi:hypothetical protein
VHPTIDHLNLLTPMNKVSEKQLDHALDEAFQLQPHFASWFVDQTKFAGMGATYLWSRSNHPWSRVAITVQDPPTSEPMTLVKEGETDVLVVFATPAGMRFALHIENKMAGGKFTPGQPDLYPTRARQWMGNPKYRSYTDFETVLVAPQAFLQRNEMAWKIFNRYIPHEDIARFVPLFGSGHP